MAKIGRLVSSAVVRSKAVVLVLLLHGSLLHQLCWGLCLDIVL